jgi:hypothetical protein
LRSAAERKAAERQRRLKAGQRQFMFWLTDEQAEKVRRFIGRLVKRRVGK